MWIFLSVYTAARSLLVGKGGQPALTALVFPAYWIFKNYFKTRGSRSMVYVEYKPFGPLTAESEGESFMLE